MRESIPSHLIIRYLSNEATTEELEQLFNWVHANRENQKVFNEWLSAWDKKIPEKYAFDLAAGLEKLNREVDKFEHDRKQNVPLLNWKNIAAAISIFLVAGISVYFLGQRGASNNDITYIERVTYPGLKLTLTLSDGSHVKLNANSTLRYPEKFSRGNREVYLTGEAFFEVKKDSLHPFIIHTGELSTQVLGTSFNINAQEDHITVSVATGKVKVSQGNDFKILHPTEKIDYLVSEKDMVKSVAHLESDLAWKDNVIVFDDTPLDEVARKLEAWYGTKIIFQNDTLIKCLVTGKYTNIPLDKVLHAISFSTGLQYNIKNNIVTLSGVGCN